MQTAKFKVGLIQMRMSPEPEENLRRAEQFIADAAGRGARVICLPELFRTRYFCRRETLDYFDLAEPIPGATTDRLSAAAAKAEAVVVASLYEKRAPGLYHNTAAVFGPDGKLLGVYRKLHIPDDPGYYEKYYFTPGDLGVKVFPTPFGRIGVLVCWDQWYPEAARLTALAGADLIFYPTAIGWDPADRDVRGEAELDAWRTMQRAHAIANGVYVAAVNRIGREGDDADGPATDFWGNSFFCDPFGLVQAQAGDQNEEILIGEIEPGRGEEVRRRWPFLRDRRIDVYGGLTKRFGDLPPAAEGQG